IQEVLGCGELFSTLFNYVQFHVYEKLTEAGVVVGQDAFEQTNFALVTTFSQSLVGERLSLTLGYDCAVLSPQQVQRIAGYYEARQRGTAGGGEGRHDARGRRGGEDAEQVRVGCNGPGEIPPRDRGVKELFEEQVSRTPEGGGVVYEEHSLTYAHLNARAN